MLIFRDSTNLLLLGWCDILSHIKVLASPSALLLQVGVPSEGATFVTEVLLPVDVWRGLSYLWSLSLSLSLFLLFLHVSFSLPFFFSCHLHSLCDSDLEELGSRERESEVKRGVLSPVTITMLVTITFCFKVCFKVMDGSRLPASVTGTALGAKTARVAVWSTH